MSSNTLTYISSPFCFLSTFITAEVSTKLKALSLFIKGIHSGLMYSVYFSTSTSLIIKWPGGVVVSTLNSQLRSLGFKSRVG